MHLAISIIYSVKVRDKKDIFSFYIVIVADLLGIDKKGSERSLFYSVCLANLNGAHDDDHQVHGRDHVPVLQQLLP